MLQVFRPPPLMAAWLDGAVAIALGPGPGVSRFPAMCHAMLTVRLQAEGGPDAEPPRFHTLHTGPTAHAHAGPLLALGLLVRPAAAATLLGPATGAVVDQVLPWSALAGDTEAQRLMAALARPAPVAHRLQALCASFGRAMATRSMARHDEAARWCTALGALGADAGVHLGLGRRQLERRCQGLLGLPPKPYQRLVRLQRVLGLATQGGAPRGAALALDAGYADQSHLARDLRGLVGEPLRPLLRQARPEAPWWSLATRRGLATAPPVWLAV